MMNKYIPTFCTALLFSANITQADQVFLDDLIVDGSACIGQDCVNGESFGFDTIRLKENNLRIKAQDTSASASFPSNDWQITFNDTSNGGLNKFSIDDIDGAKTPFTIEAGAPSHSLYVKNSGRIGLGTNTPVVDMHIKTGNTPTLRLEQDGSSGFTAQTWDVAGNEANFFIRDVTNGSKLSFKIKPGAPENSLFIAADGDIGLGTASPADDLHILDNGPARLRLTNSSKSVTATEDPDWTLNSNGSLRISAGSDAPEMTILANGNVGLGTNSPAEKLHLVNAGSSRIKLTNTNSSNPDWTFNSNGTLRVTAGNDAAELILDANGNLTILGSLTTAGGVTPDYVFKSDYNLMPLEELENYISMESHLPNIPSASEIAEKGSVNVSKMQMKLLEKIEELTLYTLEQHSTINSLKNRIAKLENNP